MLVYFTLLMDHLMVLNLKSMFGSKRKLIWILIFQTLIHTVATTELLCLKNEWFELSKFEKINMLGTVLYLPHRVTIRDYRTLGSSVWAKWQTFLPSWLKDSLVYNFFKYIDLNLKAWLSQQNPVLRHVLRHVLGPVLFDIH